MSETCYVCGDEDGSLKANDVPVCERCSDLIDRAVSGPGVPNRIDTLLAIVSIVCNSYGD